MSKEFIYEDVYKEGYQDCLENLFSVIDNTLSQEAIDVIPGKVALQVLKASLIPEWNKIIGE
jgi:hypothetical protein